MDGIQAAISVTGQGGSDTLTLNDQQAMVSHDYAINGNQILRDGATSVAFDSGIETVRVFAGNQDDQFHVNTLPQVPTTVNPLATTALRKVSQPVEEVPVSEVSP